MRRPETFTEAQLAGPLSPIVLAVGAAAATVVVTVGVIAGPGTIACIQRGDFPICMSETFFGGSGATIGDGEAAREMAAANGPQEAPSTDDAALEPSETVGSQETATSVSEAVMPAFGLVRVEPDGSAVIAGSATPSGEVRIFADDDQIGAEMVHPSGDFAFVTDAPLPTGGVELRILDVETNQFAETSVVVVVQDDRTSEALVIASVPGEASEILQGPDGQVAAQSDAPAVATTAETMAVAEAEVAETIESASEPAVPEGDAESQDAIENEPQPTETIAALGEEEGSDRQDSVSSALETAESEGDRVDEADLAPQATLTPSPEVSVEQPVAVPDSTTAAGQAGAAASVTPDEAPAAGEAGPVEAPASVDQPDDSPITTADAADVSAPGAVPSDDMSAVESQSDGAPLTSQDDAVPSPAQAADDLVAVSEAAEAVETPVAPSQPAVDVAQQTALTSPTIDAVEIDGDLNFFAGAGEDDLTVRLYVDNEVVGSTQVSDGRWLIEAIDVLDQESQRIRIDMLAQDGAVVGRAEVDFVLELPETVSEEIVVADQSEIEADGASAAPILEAEAPADASMDAPDAMAPAAPDVVDPAPTADPVESAEPAEAAEPTEVAQAPDAVEPAETDEPAIPTLVGVSDGNRTATGLAIIRQGDNLWTIARRVYGEGIRYTQIFEANTDQIRNPDLIYPGQVFDLPGTDEVIGEPDDGIAPQ